MDEISLRKQGIDERKLAGFFEPCQFYLAPREILLLISSGEGRASRARSSPLRQP
jgi:hypothetical protein